MSRLPDQHMLLELIFVSEMEFPPLYTQALLELTGQLGRYVDSQATPSSSYQSAPSLRHAALISVVISQAFEQAENQPFRQLFSIGWQLGDLIVAYGHGDLEDDQTELARFRSRIAHLPAEFQSSFLPFDELTQRAEASHFSPEQFVGQSFVLRIIRQISSKLRRISHAGIYPKRADLPDEKYSYGCVQLRDQDKSPNAYVEGVAIGKLPEITYSVVEALVLAKERGLTKDELTTESAAEDGHRTLRNLKKKEPWDRVLLSPGKKGNGGYRILAD